MRAVRWSVLVVALALAACTRQAVDPTVSAKIHKVALLEVGEPNSYRFETSGHVGQAFGAIGMAVKMADLDDRSDRLSGAMAIAGLQIGPELTGAIERALRQKGTEVVRVAAWRPAANKFVDDYPAVPPDVDAVLDTRITLAGYFSAALGGWRPELIVETRLVAPGDHRTLGVRGIKQGVTDPAYAFPGYHDVLASPDRAAAGLRAALEPLSAKIAQLK
jgi:hypothetical protein